MKLVGSFKIVFHICNSFVEYEKHKTVGGKYCNVMGGSIEDGYLFQLHWTTLKLS
jgi:hypothetical protein